MKKFILIIALILSCSWVNAQITSYPYLEDFESGDGGWLADNTNGGTWALGAPAAGVINSADSGSNAWVTNLTGNYNNNDDSFVVSPVFDLTSLAAPSIELSVWWNSEFSWDGMVLQSSIDSGASWQNVGAFGDPNNWYTDNTIAGNPGGQQEGWTGRAGSGSGGWVVARHALTGLAGESNVILRVAFGSDGSVQDEGVAFDTVSIFDVTCPEPTGITISGITSTTADISWTAAGSETNWEVVVQPLGTGVPTGPGVSTTNNPYTATGLAAVTDYEVYVRADCGANGFSNWVGAVNFLSACDVFTPDYLESFTTIIPNCWDEASDGDATTGPQGLGAGDWNQDGFLNNGFEGAYSINLWLAAKSDWILSPQFDLTGGPFQVDFDFGIMQFGSSDNAGTLGSDDTVQLLISTDNGGTWTSLVTFDNTSTVPATGTQVVFDLTAYSGQIVQFGILGSEGTVDDPEDNEIFVDNFRVRAIPSCQEPTGLTLANVTDTSADIGWTPGGAEASWEVAVQPQGTGVPTGAGLATTNNPYTATPLTPSTAYEVWVRADCGVDGLSSWIGPINFTTLNTPPPPPVGVTCASGSSSFIFTENFDQDPPAGWTGTGFDGSDGNWDITAAGANSFGTGPANAFDGGAGTHLEYEASGNSSTIASAISPAIDLTTALDGAELSFFFHAFGDDMGTLNVGISNDVAGPFTNVFTWIGDLQTSDAEAWVPVGINIDAYLGQVIYLEFSYGGAGTGFEGDMSIDFIRVESCGNFCIPPSGITVTNITGTTADIAWDANSGETSWEYVVVPAGTGEPTGAGTTVGTPSASITGLSFETDYEVWVRADCGSQFSIWAGPVNFTTTIQTNFDVDCAVGPVMGSVCYGNNDSEVFTYTSSDGSPLNLTFNAGEIEGAPFDFLVVFDSDGVTELYNDEGNNGDISGLTFQSTGDTISFQIQSDGSVSCASGSFCCSDGIDYTVACATCINPDATYQVVDDCANGDQFLVDVNVTSLGDATSLTISNNIDANTVSAPAVGVYQVGPFPFGVDVIITLSNDQDVNCVINSSAIQLLACPPVNDNPCSATVAGVNADDSCTIITSGSLLEATPSGVPDGSCAGNPDDDVWFEFTALNEFQIIQFINIDSTGFFENLDHAVYEGTCDGLVELYCSDANASLTPSLTVGSNYFIRVFSAGGDAVDYTFDLCIRPGTGNVSVDQTTYTVEELVIDVLIDSPCAQISNITWTTGTDFGQVNGIGYFEADAGSFPFEDGLLLSSGNAALAAGPNFNAMSDGTTAWPGDPDLAAIANVNTNNATIIEFDFVPLSDEISFDFLMASEEYDMGSFECNFSDAFAFLLTDSNNVTTNLAVLPGTTTPILVTNIHPDNGFCPAINEEYFGGYTPQDLPPMSFDGRTEVFTAFSPVNIGETYRIKLVIADATDSALDSGVFLKAGSFDIGEVELGADITVAAGTAACLGEQIILQTQAPSVEHVWFKDGFVIPGEITNSLVVTEAGTYTTQIIFSPSCIISDEIIVEFLPLPEANTPPDLVGCSIGADIAVFTLFDNDLPILGENQSPSDYTVTYHLTEQDAFDGVNPLVSPYTSVSDPQTIFAQVTNNTSGCINTTSFNLVLGTEPETTFTDDFDYEVCPNATVPIIIEATPVNYTTDEVAINWYLDGGLIAGENGLTLPVLLAGDYEIEVIFNDTGCSSITTQTVIELESCIIPQGISPNGDGMNDFFDLSSYGVTKLEIFNRYGTLVYSKTNYVDEWFGQTNDGEELPVGTYFYTMEYEGGKRRSAWVYIQRAN
ncbi:gliding motility-associated C-terminal domain-containing protein [Formosa sp. Hel1_31_208]|uniref:choice-of-anchor L domain-containing protein n=1 Tax=Formosa sp. Hel1_31_208 TaxID=1798225 RepID=UPI00087AC485|nr:choice-of-anchor L domain-containing protein [Formosa sp. Hel1_31_208]SDR70426.1 gliding motility-associated C-terminal domain-containing protein [Formosa sp. Hel1_31_208]